MKRWLIYPIVLGLFLLIPKNRPMDVSRLAPAEVFYIYIEEDLLTVATDTGNLGKGITLDLAIRDMSHCAAEQVFLETVDYVLVTEDTKHLLPRLNEYFRPGAKPVLITFPADPGEAASFLNHHEPGLRLCDCMAEQKVLPKLMTAGERWYLVQ